MPYSRLTVITFFFLALATSALSQSTTLDSLTNELQNHPEQDTIRVHLLNDLAYKCYREDLDQAKAYVEESEALARAIGFIKGHAQSLFVKAQIKVFQYDFDQGIEFFNEALKLNNSINFKKGIARCYNGMGVLFYSKGDKLKAIDHYEESIKVYQEIGNTSPIATITNNIGRAYSELGNYNDAIKSYKEALALYEEADDEIGMAYCFNNLGTVHTYQGNYLIALTYHDKCMKIAQKKEHSWLLAASLSNIANIHNYQEDYDKAIASYKKILENPTDTDQKVIATVLSNLGLLYKEKQNFDQAHEVLNEAIRIHTEMNNRFDLASPLNNIGDTYLQQKEYQAAYEHFQQGKEISLEVENQRSLCYSYLGITKIHIHQKAYREALGNALKGQEIANKLALLNYRRDAAELLSEIYENMGDYSQAFRSHKQFKTLNDSLFDKKNIERLTQLEFEYKYQQALDSASIRELKLTKIVTDTNEDLEKSRQYYLWATISFLLMLIILGAIIFYLKLRNAKAQTHNVIVEQQLLRSQMTPHFIFNSLSVLQGMILNKEEQKSVSYLSKFSKLLRIILENSRDKTVSLDRELSAIRNYLALQNLENDAYQSTVSVDDDIDIPAFEVPPMLIQPFVENVIEHAFVNQEKNRIIDVHLSYTNGNLVCKITDNGVGVDSQIAAKNQKKKSLSTTITSERLRILSKDLKMKGSLLVEDRKKYNEQGTVVTLIIPYKLGKAS